MYCEYIVGYVPSYNWGNSTSICHLDKNGCKLEHKHSIKNEKRCRAAYGLKKNENNGDVELTRSQKNNNRLKTDKYMTVIHT